MPSVPQPSSALITGLRLAFGPAGVERALAAVLALWRCYDGHRRRPASVTRHRTRSVGAEERLLIGLIATARQGADVHHAAIVLRLVRGGSAETVAEAARELAILLAAPGSGCPAGSATCRPTGWPGAGMAAGTSRPAA